MRDYFGLMNEWIFQTEIENDGFQWNENNKDIFKKYLQNNLTNEITDFDLSTIMQRIV